MLFAPALLIPLLAASAPVTREVVTPLDYFNDGRAHVDAFLNGRMAETVKESKARCVRVALRSESIHGAYRSVLGSGVVLDGGRYVLTAGHVVDGFEADEIQVTLVSGEVHFAELLDYRYDALGAPAQDWAILELRTVPELEPLVETDEATIGTLALLFGYPDHIGVAPDGKMTFGETSTPYLEPIVTVGTIQGNEPLTLAPHVGAVPTGGMSGGPVFDTHGRLLGILVSVLRYSGSDSGYRYRIVPISEIPEIEETR